MISKTLACVQACSLVYPAALKTAAATNNPVLISVASKMSAMLHSSMLDMVHPLHGRRGPTLTAHPTTPVIEYVTSLQMFSLNFLGVYPSLKVI
jgi:hypothetical protein